MPASPYATLMRFKRWATLDLDAVIAAHIDRIDDGDQMLLRHILDHIHCVDDIFRHHLEGRAHGRRAPRSDDLPSFDMLRCRATATAAWYVAYADALSAEAADESLAFTYANGEPARMSCGEILLHVAAHGTYHRGNAGVLLQKNGIEPNADRLTDYLDHARAAA